MKNEVQIVLQETEAGYILVSKTDQARVQFTS